MDIRELSYFYQVAKNSSFTLAAQILHISQPALSKTIKKLEAELDIQLFDRTNNEIKLTEKGEYIFKETEKILNQFENLKNSFFDQSNHYTGKVRVGIPPVIGSSVFVKILSSFRTQYPNITVEITESGAKVQEHNLQNGTIDLGVVITPVDQKKFECIPILEDQSVLVVNKSNPLSKKEMVDFDDLKNEIFLILDKTYMLHYQIIDNCRSNGFTPNIYFESSQWDFLVELVAHNQGITILPAPILKYIENKKIEIIPFKNKLKWEIVFLLNKDQFVTHAMKTFIDHTLKVVR